MQHTHTQFSVFDVFSLKSSVSLGLFLEHTHTYTCNICAHSFLSLMRSFWSPVLLQCFLSFMYSVRSHPFCCVCFLNTHLLMQHSRTLLPYQPVTDSLWHFCQGRQELVPFSVSISNCRGTFCVLKLEEMTCSTGFSSQSKALDAQSSFPRLTRRQQQRADQAAAGWPVTLAVWNRMTVTVICILSLCETGWPSGWSELMAQAHVKSSSGFLGLFLFCIFAVSLSQEVAQTPSTGIWHPSFNHCCI